jgi:hypothetical protein
MPYSFFIQRSGSVTYGKSIGPYTPSVRSAYPVNAKGSRKRISAPNREIGRIARWQSQRSAAAVSV